MNPIRKLRIAGLIEGTTLLVLLLIAVPLKHIGGIPQFVSVMGPLHGAAFIA
jgi:integral membrane protein